MKGLINGLPMDITAKQYYHYNIYYDDKYVQQRRGYL